MTTFVILHNGVELRIERRSNGDVQITATGAATFAPTDGETDGLIDALGGYTEDEYHAGRHIGGLPI